MKIGYAIGIKENTEDKVLIFEIIDTSENNSSEINKEFKEFIDEIDKLIKIIVGKEIHDCKENGYKITGIKDLEKLSELFFIKINVIAKESNNIFSIKPSIEKIMNKNNDKCVIGEKICYSIQNLFDDITNF